MEYSIFFDESKKIDRESKFSYFGAISIADEELLEIEKNIETILENINRHSELHFVKYKSADIKKYFQVINYVLSMKTIKFNVYRLNNQEYLKLGNSTGFNETDLKKYFYVKIPERLFYGLVRDDIDIDGLNIVMDSNEEYNAYDVFQKIEDQMNAHALYRGKNYCVKSIKALNSDLSRMLQVLDVILGIVVHILEENFTSESNGVLSKQDFIYRLFSEDHNLEKFHNIITIYSWEKSAVNSISKIEMSNFTSKFLKNYSEKYKKHLIWMNKFYLDMQEEFKKISEYDRNRRIELLKKNFYNPYTRNKLTNSWIEIFLGCLSDVEFDDKNKYIRMYE